MDTCHTQSRKRPRDHRASSERLLQQPQQQVSSREPSVDIATDIVDVDRIVVTTISPIRVSEHETPPSVANAITTITTAAAADDPRLMQSSSAPRTDSAEVSPSVQRAQRHSSGGNGGTVCGTATTAGSGGTCARDAAAGNDGGSSSNGEAPNANSNNNSSGGGVGSPTASSTAMVTLNNSNNSASVEGHGGAGPAAANEQRRYKQVTLAAYGLVSDTAVLRKELAETAAHVDELTAKTAALEEELRRREGQMTFVQQQHVALEAKLHRFRDVLREEMLRAAKGARREARRALHQKHFELGQIAVLPQNGREVWVEGDRMRSLLLRQRELSERREVVEQLKKNAQSTVKQLGRQDRDKEDSTNAQDGLDGLLEAQEELQLRTAEHAALTNMLAALNEERAGLEQEKKAFLKEIRRLSDEDASEFLVVPTIGEEERYVLMHLLGRGGFSEVWRAFDLTEGRYVACKIHRVHREWSAQTREHYVRHAERELAIMRAVHHPHVIQLYDVFRLTETEFVSVMEYSHGMDLDTYLKRYHALKEGDARLLLLQVVSALRYLAALEQPIIHYDLKPANILFHSADPSVLEIKITDFGLSKIVYRSAAMDGGPSDNPSIELTSQGTGTYWYLPPECFDTASAAPRISPKVDIWSVGVIFYQMLYGRRPFAEGESQRKIWQEKLILSAARTLTFPDSPRVSEEAKEIIRGCLAFNVNERYDIGQLSQHPYLSRCSRRSGRGRHGVVPSTAAAPLAAPSVAPARAPTVSPS